MFSREKENKMSIVLEILSENLPEGSLITGTALDERCFHAGATPAALLRQENTNVNGTSQ